MQNLNNFAECLQIHTSCQTNLHFDLTPKFSKQIIHVTSNSVSRTVTISSPDIKFNEQYIATVRLEETDLFSYNICFSKLVWV